MFTQKLKRFIKYFKDNYLVLTVGAFVVFIYSFLFFKTVYSTNTQYFFHFLVYGDFTATGSIIQQFYYNLLHWPIEYPMFSGGIITYHFGFMFLTALLEYITHDLTLALNILSVISLIFLLITFYKLMQLVFSSRKKSCYIFLPFTLLVFIVNPSIEYLLLFKQILSIGIQNTLNTLKSLTIFYQYGPYQAKDIVSVFWNLNTMVNQRHFILGIAILFLLIFLTLQVINSKKTKYKYNGLLIVLLTAFLIFIHKAFFLVWGIFGGTLIIIIFLDLIVKAIKKQKVSYKKVKFISAYSFIILGISVIVLQVLYHQFTIKTGLEGIQIRLGFLYNSVIWQQKCHPFVKWVLYNLANFSIYIVGGLLGFLIFIRKNKLGVLDVKNAIFYSAVITFIVANVVAFALDIAINHKLINFSLYIFITYSFYFVYVMFKRFRTLGLFLILFVAISLSTNLLLDIFPYFYKGFAIYKKETHNPVSLWILKNTKPTDNFLNLTYEVMPVTLAGRKVFFGWDYYSMSAGYNTLARRQTLYDALDALPNTEKLCILMTQNNLKYLYVADKDTSFIERNFSKSFFLNYNITPLATFKNVARIYSISQVCDYSKYIYNNLNNE